MALGWNEIENKKRGSVCSKHFRDEDIKKKGQKIILNAGSVPSIFPNEEELNFDDEGTIEEIIMPASEVRCPDCELRDQNMKTNQTAEEQILQLETENLKLKKDLSKARSKIYYMESIKIKLKNTIKEMKKQKLIDSKIQRGKEVNLKLSRCLIFPDSGFQIHFYRNPLINPIQNVPSKLYIPHVRNNKSLWPHFISH